MLCLIRRLNDVLFDVIFQNVDLLLDHKQICIVHNVACVWLRQYCVQQRISFDVLDLRLVLIDHLLTLRAV